MPISTSDAFRHMGEISTFVALDSQKQGVGGSLCRATFETAKELGYLKLRATVRGDNPHALTFYRSQGFELVGVAKAHAFLNGKYIVKFCLKNF